MSYIVSDRMKRRAQLTMSCSDVSEKVHRRPTAIAKKIVRCAVRDTRRDKFALSKCQLACTLHQQADQLHKKLLPGDYEAALVLYHRAARLSHQNEVHNVAKKKMSTLKSSTSLSIKKSPSTPGKNKKRISPVSHPHSPSKDIEQHLKYLQNPTNVAKNSLRCYDTKKDLKGMILSLNEMESIRSQVMLSQLNKMACKTLRSLKESFSKNHFDETIKIGDDLQRIISLGLEDQYCYQVAVHRYLALAHLSLRRHDRAVEHSAKMIFSAKRSNDINLRIRSFAVFGKVHLTFGHLTAAVKGWENLLTSLKEDVPRAWLLHEIGRGYYEMRNYLKALEISKRCYEWAEEGGSNKWMYHGKLLGGQAFICLGRFNEGLEMLQRASNIAEIDNDSSMVGYIQCLMEIVADAMRNQVKRVEKDCLTDIYAADLDLNDDETLKDFGKVSDEFGYKLFTSRARVIQRSGVGENRENSINTRGDVSVGVEINGSDTKNYSFVDKWKKYLNDNRTRKIPTEHSEAIPSGLTINELGIEARRDGELTQASEVGELCSHLSSGEEESEGGNDGGGNDSKDSRKIYGDGTDLLYQCFAGNGGSSDDDSSVF